MNIDFARRQMVEQQIRAWEVSDSRVLDVLSELPREEFVPPGYEALAFADTSIPLAHGQRMFTPTLEGRLLQSLGLSPADDVFEVGTGSGFLTACLARLSGTVTSIDLFADFIEAAERRLKSLDIGNTTLIRMDAMQALPQGPFDAIAVGGSLPVFDSRFLDLLKPGGRLFVVVGSGPIMDAQLIVHENGPRVTSLFETRVQALCHAPVPPAFDF
jgi:protein-L-isoaspartate(D-aspartate) O-methyltransferase